MPPTIALIVYLIFTIILFWKDSSQKTTCSKALWIPVIWFLIALSRPISLWFGAESNPNVDYYIEGSPLDRFVYIVLIGMSFFVLSRRSICISNILRNNVAILLFLIYCAMSIAWSDYPFVSFKRFIKAIGSYSVILIILSEYNQSEAIKTVIRRCAFLLIPLSICFIKYFPSIGRGYSEWTGEVQYNGVTGNKNMLGTLCLVCGLVFMSDLIDRFGKDRETESIKRSFIPVVVLALILWLLYISNSATSTICFIVGSAIIAGSKLDIFQRHSRNIGVYIGLLLLFYYVIDLNFNITESMIGRMGRDTTLTDRTIIWETVLSMGSNPWVGAGYESFWLGSRMAHLREFFPFTINQAHSGYIEMYLNLGYIGLLFLFIVIISGYLRISRTMSDNYDKAVLGLAFLVVLLFYNITEAAFKDLHVLWNLFLMMTIEYARQMPVKESVTGARSGELSSQS